MAIRASWLPLYAALLCSLFLLFRPPEPVYADQDVGGLVAGAKVVAPEMVTNVARGASDTAATVSIGFDGWGPYGSAGSGDVEARLRYGTAPGQWASTVTECDGDGVAGCVGEPGELLTFSLTGLTTGQEYHYQIETRRPSGSGTQALWTPRPAGRFVASRPETGFVSFTFLHFSDTHTGAAFPRAECGNADDAASLTLYRTMARMAQERADFSLDTGDTAALRSPIAFACNELGGLSTGDDPQGAPGEPISTGLARWRLTLQHPRLYANLLRLGGAFAIALGNHEGETGFDSTCTTGSSPPGTCSVPTYCNGGSRDGLSCWTGGFGCPGGGTCEPLPCASDECDNVGVPRYDYDEHGTGHYAHSGPSGESQKQLARDARVQVMPPWTTGSGHTDGYYYAFDWGNSRFIVMDPFAFYDPSVKAWGHPEWPEDWMMGSAQWAWAQARIDECEADADCDFVFVGTHHIVGGHQVEGKWYHYGRHCMKGTDCLDSDDQDGSIDEDFRGEHALLQAYLKAAVDSGGITAGIVLLGHDHLGAWGEKQDAGGGSGIWYVSATQAVDTAWSAQCSGGTFAGSPCADAGDCPGGGTCDSLAGGPRGGPNWSENPTALDGFDYDADGTAQYRENPLDAAAPGSLLRGYHRVTVNESPPSVTFEAIGSQIIETGSGATKPDPQDGTVLFDLDVSSFWETRLDQLTGCANNDPLPFAVSQDGDDVDETSDSLWLACSLAIGSCTKPETWTLRIRTAAFRAGSLRRMLTMRDTSPLSRIASSTSW